MKAIHWESKLNKYIDDCRNKKFDWASNNCGEFVLEWEKIFTGDTKFPEFYKKSKSLQEVKQKLNKLGFKSWISMCNKRLTKKRVSLAKRGDLVSVRSNNSFCMGICLGQHSAFLEKNGITFFLTEKVKYAWSWF